MKPYKYSAAINFGACFLDGLTRTVRVIELHGGISISDACAGITGTKNVFVDVMACSSDGDTTDGATSLEDLFELLLSD